MALLDLQAMQPSAAEYGGGDAAGSTSSTGCGVGSDLSVLICAASSLSLTNCH